MTSPTHQKAKPRPALRRATDADIHPALAVVPAKEAMPIRRPAAVPERPASPGASAPAGADIAKGKDKGKQQRFTGAGKTTSDAMRVPRGKSVDLGVEVPKPLRKEIRRVAKAAGKTPDALVASVLAAWLGDPGRR